MGCASRERIVVIPSDKMVILHKAGETVTFEKDVYLVSPERMQEILHKLAEQK